MQLLVGISPHLTRLTFPNERGLVLAMGLYVTVETVIGKINLAAGEPLCPGAIPFQNFVPFPEPMQFFGDTRPEFLRLIHGFTINPLVVVGGLYMRLRTEELRAFKLALLLKHRVYAGVGNG